MPERVRVGMIGTSWWAEGYHLPILQTHPRAEVAAVCGRNRERAEAIAAKFGIPAVYTDYRAMYERAGLDAVVIAGPDDLHYQMAMDAIERGLHVVGEKPLATTAVQAEAMYRRAEAAKVKHLVNFTLRWLPTHQFLHELIQGGYLGQIYHVEMTHLSGGQRSGKYAWRFDPRYGGGSLGDLGSHSIDQARFLVGEITRVAAHLAAPVPLTAPDGATLTAANQTAMVLLQFENGAEGVIHVSGLANVGNRGAVQRYRLDGAGGVLESEIDLAGVAEVHGTRQGESRPSRLPIPEHIREAAGKRDAPAHLFPQSTADYQFVEAILRDLPLTPSFYDGWKAQQVIEAAFEAAKSGKWVDVG
ncbi:MAG TPA: Gfo/Idh/MocA family oxidoreductase [Chloroflexota bacterium]|nr:Gfo/Idh/MocA family oxidoreductase [Chloroflexota bacterium]